MSNVISFPKPQAQTARSMRETGAKTLFLHVKNATMIVHLAAPKKIARTGERVGKTT